jgi:hypothetical protein
VLVTYLTKDNKEKELVDIAPRGVNHVNTMCYALCFKLMCLSFLLLIAWTCLDRSSYALCLLDMYECA